MILCMVAALALAFGIGLPLPKISNRWAHGAGWLIACCGVALDVWAIVTMRRAHTNILPHRPADRLVTRGPFARTRNPIYVGKTLLMVGVGLAFGNAWFGIFGLAGAIAVDRLAIRREERHLAERFRNDWIEYSSRVPRWLV